MPDNLQKFSKYLENQTELQLGPKHLQRNILRELFQRGPLSPIEISLATYSSLENVEKEIDYLQEKRLLKKFREIDGQQFFSLSYKGVERKYQATNEIEKQKKLVLISYIFKNIRANLEEFLLEFDLIPVVAHVL